MRTHLAPSGKQPVRIAAYMTAKPAAKQQAKADKASSMMKISAAAAAVAFISGMAGDTATLAASAAVAMASLVITEIKKGGK